MAMIESITTMTEHDIMEIIIDERTGRFMKPDWDSSRDHPLYFGQIGVFVLALHGSVQFVVDI